MILHSIVSPSDIFFNSTDVQPRRHIYRRINGGLLELDGNTVTRLISTDPRLYLDRRYCPDAHFNNSEAAPR